MDMESRHEASSCRRANAEEGSQSRLEDVRIDETMLAIVDAYLKKPVIREVDAEDENL